MLNELVPLTSAALAGNTAVPSLLVIPTVSVTFVSKFQLASTARTVTVNAVPTVCAVGAPVLPVGVPDAAVSPGSNTCNWLYTSGLTATTLEIAEANAPLVKTIVMFVAIGCARFA